MVYWEIAEQKYIFVHYKNSDISDSGGDSDRIYEAL